MPLNQFTRGLTHRGEENIHIIGKLASSSTQVRYNINRDTTVTQSAVVFLFTEDVMNNLIGYTSITEHLRYKSISCA